MFAKDAELKRLVVPSPADFAVFKTFTSVESEAIELFLEWATSQEATLALEDMKRLELLQLKLLLDMH